MRDSATDEAAQPLVEVLPRVVEVPACPPRRKISTEIEDHLAAIEAEAAKWLGGRHSIITRHVAGLRKLL